jgi:hypothetical protein
MYIIRHDMIACIHVSLIKHFDTILIFRKEVTTVHENTLGGKNAMLEIWITWKVECRIKRTDSERLRS